MEIDPELAERVQPEDAVEPEDDAAESNGHSGSDDLGSLLGHIRDIRETYRKKEWVQDFVVPGYQDLVLVRCRPFPAAKSESKSEALRKRAERGDPIILDACCDTLIDSCEQIMVRKSRDSKPIPIDDEMPIRFDARLAELFQLDVPDPPRARAVVKQLFLTEQSLISTAIQVNEWLKDVTKDSDEEALGE